MQVKQLTRRETIKEKTYAISNSHIKYFSSESENEDSDYEGYKSDNSEDMSKTNELQNKMGDQSEKTDSTS